MKVNKPHFNIISPTKHGTFDSRFREAPDRTSSWTIGRRAAANAEAQGVGNRLGTLVEAPGNANESGRNVVKTMGLRSWLEAIMNSSLWVIINPQLIVISVLMLNLTHY